MHHEIIDQWLIGTVLDLPFKFRKLRKPMVVI